VILNATALFNHANIDLPRPVDRVLRLIVGIEQFRTRRDLWLDRMLNQPARRGPASDHALDPRITGKEPSE
jgi:hypothetical protein